jgi:hypothetical protein
MTATQYLQRKQRLFEWGYWVAIWAMIIMAVTTVVIFSHGHHSNIQTTLNFEWFVLQTILPTALVATFLFLGSGRLHKNFVRNHPEMKHLDQWMQLGESAENFPTEENRLQAEERIARILLGFALAADTIFQMRNRLITGAWEDKHEYYRVINDLNERAAMLNQKYLSYWTLVIDKMKAIPTPDTDPRTFRESKRWSMYPPL